MSDDWIKDWKDCLPSDWWKRKSVSEILSDWFRRYLIGLFISVEIQGNVQHALYTGFLLFYKEKYIWITSGHIIDEIEKIKSEPNYKILRMRWVDNYKIPGAESIPVHDYDIKTFSASGYGIDFGNIEIVGLDRENILKNSQLNVMTEQGWKNLHLAKPEGYYILGYPKEWITIEEKNIYENQKIGSLFANISFQNSFV